jgi:uncharacterized protein (DUF1684 family)
MAKGRATASGSRPGGRSLGTDPRRRPELIARLDWRSRVSPADREYVRELEAERQAKDRFFAEHPESPFAVGSVGGFRGLRYFPPDARWRVSARLERRAPPPEAYLRTNRDGQLAVRWTGDLAFRLSARDLRLRVYRAEGAGGTSVFVPFRDRTSGRESYGPGRYVTLELDEGETYELDFNRAFNPYCAYTDAFECGFAPPENDLPVAIRAGERVWSPERNPPTPEAAIRALLPGRAAVPAGKARKPSGAATDRGRP